MDSNRDLSNVKRYHSKRDLKKQRVSSTYIPGWEWTHARGSDVSEQDSVMRRKTNRRRTLMWSGDLAVVHEQRGHVARALTVQCECGGRVNATAEEDKGAPSHVSRYSQLSAAVVKNPVTSTILGPARPQGRRMCWCCTLGTH